MSITPFPLPIALTPADRKALRARAHHLDPVVMIGDAGLSRAVLAEADRALGAHELIKIRVLGDDRAQRTGDGECNAAAKAGTLCHVRNSLLSVAMCSGPMPQQPPKIVAP